VLEHEEGNPSRYYVTIINPLSVAFPKSEN
jgi:hypothetical protein